MGTEKRERQKANREARLAAEAAADARKRRIRFIRNAVILTIVIIAVGFALAGCSSDGSDAKVTSNGASTDAGTERAVEYGTGACPPEGGSAKPVVTFTAAPKRCIDLDKTYTAAVTTTEGSFSLRFDTERTPLTTNNFVVLARYGYFDGTDLFRTEAGSGILQGGSPHTQDNSDPGPGYTIPDEGLPFSSADYAAGTIAMARTAAPDSASGQFFLLANDGGAYLGDAAQLGDSAGTYAVFGTVTDGLDVLAKIAALDTGAGAPSKQVTIQKVTISER